MALPRRLHIFGASGSGTTSLASLLAARHGHRHLDSDEFFWLRTDPPYRETRPRAARLALLRRALGEAASWVLSGSLCGWGDPVIAEFDLVVFLAVPMDVRLARLRAREVERYGHEAIAPGGPRRQAHVEFLDWAGRYDTGGPEMRSRALHDAWLAALPGPTLRAVRASGPRAQGLGPGCLRPSSRRADRLPRRSERARSRASSNRLPVRHAHQIQSLLVSADHSRASAAPSGAGRGGHQERARNSWTRISTGCRVSN